LKKPLIPTLGAILHGARILVLSVRAGPMDETRLFKHLGYELLCGAKAVDSGKFAPTLIVTKQAWPKRPRVIAVPRGDFISQTTAIDAAHAQGLEWIVNYGARLG
jgi:hypothetical protein